MAETQKGKDSLMKLLLSTTPANATMPSLSVPSPASSVAGHQSGTSNSSNLPSPSSESGEDSGLRLSNYLQQLTGQSERECSAFSLDHTYCKPWNWRPENTYAKPTKTLFVQSIKSSSAAKINFLSVVNGSTSKQEHNGVQRKKDGENVPGEGMDFSGIFSEEEVDVLSEQPNPVPPYDMHKVRPLMEECENHVNFVKREEEVDADEWEERVNRVGWSAVQTRLFNKMVRVLHLDRLARLAHAGSWNEPVLRRVSIDKSVRRVRQMLFTVNWETKLTQWLHATLIEHLPKPYLAAYLDILQSLKAKVPSLVEKMINVSTLASKTGPASAENLNQLLKRAWDPAAGSLSQHKPRKLPGHPILLIAPSSPSSSCMQAKRAQHWVAHFSTLGQVVMVMMQNSNSVNHMTMTNCLDQMIAATRSKMGELKTDFPGRPIILIGWNTGAAVACQVALLEQVTAVVCLGFPVLTVEGKRGEPNDTLLDLHCPILFVIGQNAATVRQEDIEDIRERMRVETGLVVVGSADDQLRVTKMKKLMEGVTQSMIDRCIVEEVGDFLGSILINPYQPPLRPPQLYTANSPVLTAVETSGGRQGTTKIERKSKHISSSSIDSEPASPASKRSRPGTPLNGHANTISAAAAVAAASAAIAPTQRRKPRSAPGQKMVLNQNFSGSQEQKWGGSVRHSVSSNMQGMSAAGGFTVNIGSLASLTPLGPIRLAPSSATSVATSSTTTSTITDMKKECIRNPDTSVTTSSTEVTSSVTMASPTTGRSTASRSVASTVLHLQGKQVLGGRSAGSSALTALSSLLQGGTATRIVTSSPSSSILLTPSTDKVVGNEETLQSIVSSGSQMMAPARVLPASGRPLDLSKLTVLTSSSGGTAKNVLGTTSGGNVVMLAESHTTGSGSSVLVPFSSVAPSPITILPMTTTKTGTSGQRSLTVIPTASRQTKMTGPKLSTYTVPSGRPKKEVASKHKKITKGEAPIPPADDDDALTPAKILELPIIFAKDDDSVFSSTAKTEPDVLSTPIVVPVDPSAAEDGSSSVLTTGDTISFPLEDDETEQIPQLMKQPTPQNVVLIKGLNSREKQASGRPLIQKTQRILHTIGKMGTQKQGQSSSIKYAKIILTNRNPTVKVDEQDTGSNNAEPEGSEPSVHITETDVVP